MPRRPLRRRPGPGRDPSDRSPIDRSTCPPTPHASSGCAFGRAGERTRTDGVVFFTEFHDSRLYGWFRSVGLTPRKSLTLGAIDVPDAYVVPLARGLMDGDGSILNFVHRPTVKAQPNYWYERLSVCFHAASRPHIDWLRSRLLPIAETVGYVETAKRDGRHDFFKLKYGKAASAALLSAFYADPAAPKLVRKWRIWDAYVERTANA